VLVRKIYILKNIYWSMVLEVMSVNWLAIIIAAVVSFIFGWLWFGPLFGKAWLKGCGMSAKEAKKMHKEGMAGKMIWYFVGTIITTYVVANLIGWIGVGTFGEAIHLALWLGIGFFAATTMLGDKLWKGRPWSFFFINAVFWIINLAIIGAVLVGFG